MSPNKIKALLIEHDVKQRDIAAKLGVTPGTVSAAISGDRKYRSRRVHDEVAAQVKRPIHKLWPKLYA
ncbi:MAG: helix-turn-helix transcriptional regulator [Geobacter sp.]|nr:helix-turn-helix transcriptional regulator [Geobacter sp.]